MLVACGCCLLCVVRCLLLVVSCLLFVVCCLLLLLLLLLVVVCHYIPRTFESTRSSELRGQMDGRNDTFLSPTGKRTS